MAAVPTLSSDEWALWHDLMEAQRILAAEVDAALQSTVGISKAEFSVLVTLRNSPEAEIRVGDLAAALRWEKSRVAHLLSRMESRGLVQRAEGGAPGRRTAISLSSAGRDAAEAALLVHARTIRRLFFDRVTTAQAAAIQTWSEDLIRSTTVS
jgi:DNA-binding MarR family transcriptional regulator